MMHEANYAERRMGVIRGLAMGTAVLCLLVATGCAAAQAAEAPIPPVEVTLSLDAQDYRIGEPLWVTVTVRNTTARELIVPPLDGNSLAFRCAQQGSAQPPRRREPVLPALSDAAPRTLAVQGMGSRRLVFTLLTAEPGQWGLVASLSGCAAAGGDAELAPTCYSNPAYYTVSETVALRRDSVSGIITREQAIELARGQAGVVPGARARAVLVPYGDLGIYDWLVSFGGGEGDALTEGSAFAINPYTGAVKPYEPADALERRGN